MMLQKCDEVARTYDSVQAAYAAILDLDDNIESIKCNVVLDDIEDGAYDTVVNLFYFNFRKSIDKVYTS